MLLSSSFKLNANTLKLGQAKIKVGNGAEQNADIVAVGDSSIYIAYNKPVAANQDVVVNIPFTAIESNNLSKRLTVEAYVSQNKPTDPFKPGADRSGTDKMGVAMIIYNEAFARDRSNDVFVDNAVRPNFLFGYFDSYHGNNFYSPFFKNEVRRLAKPQTFTVEFPAGYLVKSDLKVENRNARDQHVKDNLKQEVALVSKSENANGRITYTYDLTTIFAEVKTQAEADALPTNKWMHPDDIFYYGFGLDVQATKGAEPLGEVVSNISFINAVEADSLMDRTHKFAVSYTGDRTALTVTPSDVKAFEDVVHLPIATVLNPNAYDAQMWVYIDGKVKDAAAIPSKGGATIQGKGVDNRWIDLGLIKTRESETFQIDFTPLATICSPDTIKIYTVSSFNTAWTPDFSKGVDPEDIDHVAAGKTVTIEPTLATIEGKLSTSSTLLTHGTAYTLRASIDSKASASVLVDPQMKITIPAGQKYVAGTGKVEYPIGTAPVALPATVENALLASNSSLDTSREFVFKVSEAINVNKLQGFYSSVTDKDREVVLTADFTPECETSLTGIHFQGQLDGQNLCSIIASGVDKIEVSQDMFSGLTTDYEFVVDAKIASGNNAFNEIRTEDKLQVEVSRKNGTAAVLNTDGLYLYLPQYLDLKDPAAIEIKSSDLPAAQGKATVLENTVKDGTRLIKLSLPVAAINAEATHGVGKKMTYEIDLLYTPDKTQTSLIENPIYSIKSIVTTDKQFSPSCPSAPMAIGNHEFKVALVSASQNPYKGKVSEVVPMQIINPTFKGEWFADATGGTALSVTDSYDYTPTQVGDVTFYVSSIFDGVDYGRVPILLTTTSVDFVVTNPAAPICSGSSIDLATLVSGYDPSVTIKYYSDAAASNELPSSTVSPTVTTLYYVQGESGIQKSDVKSIDVKVNANTAITLQPVGAAYDDSGILTLTVAATGDNLTYQWQKDGVDIVGATTATFTKANIHDTDKGVYTVVVSGDCGSVVSSAATVTVYSSLEVIITDLAAICDGESADLAQSVSGIGADLTVKYYSDASATAELIDVARRVAPHKTTSYYVQASNPNGTKGVVKEIKVTVYETPSATFSNVPVEVCENTDASVTLQLTGTAPWKVVYSDGVKDYTISDIQLATYTFTIPVAKTSTYTIKQVFDAHCQNIAATGSVTIEANTPVEITKQPTGLSFCPGSAVSLSIEAEGTVVGYQWFKDGKAINGATDETLEISNPSDSDNGEYYVEVTGKCGVVSSAKALITKTLDKVIIQKWNSTLVANNNEHTNGGYKFKAYKWFKNGTLVGQMPYYTVGNDSHNLLDPDAVYHAEVTTVQGQVFVTCPFTAVLREGSVKVYPNPVAMGAITYVDADIDESELKGATISVYNMSGFFVGNYKVKERITELNLPLSAGSYIVKFKSKEIEKSVVIIVK